MTEKVKLTKAAVQPVPPPPPPAWVMDPNVSNLYEIFRSDTRTSIQISSLTLEYEKKCAQAKTELYDELNKLLKTKL
jgi:hypothetical protein